MSRSRLRTNSPELCDYSPENDRTTIQDVVIQQESMPNQSDKSGPADSPVRRSCRIMNKETAISSDERKESREKRRKSGEVNVASGSSKGTPNSGRHASKSSTGTPSTSRKSPKKGQNTPKKDKVTPKNHRETHSTRKEGDRREALNSNSRRGPKNSGKGKQTNGRGVQVDGSETQSVRQSEMRNQARGTVKRPATRSGQCPPQKKHVTLQEECTNREQRLNIDMRVSPADLQTDRCRLNDVNFEDAKELQFGRSGQYAVLIREESFSSCHRLHSDCLDERKNQFVFGKCNNPNGHGHNYRIKVYVRGQINSITGMIYNMTYLKQEIKQVIDQVDHKNLDKDVPFFKTRVSTTENLAMFFVNALKSVMSGYGMLYKIELWETDKNSVIVKVKH